MHIICVAVSQQDGPGFDPRIGQGTFLSRVFMLTPCKRGFPLGTTVSYHSPKACMLE